MRRKINIIGVLFYFYTALLIFEIPIRVWLGERDSIVNLLKLGFTIILSINYFLGKLNNKSTKENRFIHASFFILIIIIAMKLISAQDYNSFLSWIQVNNNINFIFYYLYYISIVDLKLDLDLYGKYLWIINFIVIAISFLFFYTNNYMGTVKNTALINYAWVGTNKYRMMSIFGSPNHAGLYFLVMLCILDYYRVKDNKSILSISNLLIIICNILTFSRTSIISMIIYFYLRYLIIRDKNVRSRIMNIIYRFRVIIILAIFSVLAKTFITKFNIYFFSIQYFINNPRWDRWIIAVNFIRDNPIIGTPFYTELIGLTRSYEYVLFSDNMFLEIGARFGGIILLLITIGLIKRVYVLLKNKNYFELNKFQIIIISFLASGAIHFSIPLFLFIFYSCKLKFETNIMEPQIKNNDRTI